VPSIPPTINRAEFKKTENNIHHYYVLPEVFRNEICTGFEYRQVCKFLIEAVWIKTDKDNTPYRRKYLPGLGGPAAICSRLGFGKIKGQKNQIWDKLKTAICPAVKKANPLIYKAIRAMGQEGQRGQAKKTKFKKNVAKIKDKNSR